MAGRGKAAGVRDRPATCATDREVVVVAAVLVAGSEKAAAHRLGVSHSTVKHHLANARSKVGVTTTAQRVWILAERLPKPDGTADPGACRDQPTDRRYRGANFGPCLSGGWPRDLLATDGCGGLP